MAADEAILNAHLEGLSPPTLRIYGFSPSAITVGSSQKLPPYTIDRARSAGFDVVRRPSGGRAVLHHGDLTYCFVGTCAVDKTHLTAEQFLIPSIVGAYQQICRGLILAFKRFGLTIEFGEHRRGSFAADCFASTTTGDLHIAGLKIVGSAQLRRKTAVLQHGTIVLRQDAGVMESLLEQNNNIDINQSKPARHANLYDLLGYDMPIHELQTAILHGFQDAFQVVFTPGHLSSAEHKSTHHLVNKQTCT